MKKLLIVLSCVLPMCLFGCASKSAPVTNETEAPQIEEDVVSTTEEETSEADDAVESDIDNTNDEVEDLENNTANVYPELEELEEPEVITLDPPLPEEELTVEEQEEEPELVETELPLEETQDTLVVITDETEEASKNPDEEPDKNANDNVENEDSELSVSETDDVIDITDDDASAVEDTSEMIAEDITPSRKVTIKKSEYLDIVYPGNGWVYMGLTDGSKDLVYNGRKLGTGQTKFTLQAKNPGIKIIHFYKEDNLSDTTLDDYIEVEILNEKGSNKDHVTAPEYKLPLTKKAKEIIEVNTKKAEVKEEKVTETVIEKTPAETVTPAEKTYIPSPAPVERESTETKKSTADSKLLLKEAQLLYNEKEYSAANKKIEEFFEVAVNNRDEGLYLQGQILEAKSSIQNIKAAIEAYTTLTKNYPASKYWDDANKRIIYLKRFYLEVR